MEQGSEVFGGDVDERLAHDGAGLFVVVDADELVEELLPEWSKEPQARDAQEELAGLGQREADDALDVAGVADAGGGAEVKMSDWKGGLRIANVGIQTSSQFYGNPSSMGMSEEKNLLIS